tara:strand:+ start:656 stop:1003 length:348 start_codon:yes stop_codon:yes gene_type:complete
MKRKIICFDIDGIICKTVNGDYEKSTPINKNIDFINSLNRKKIKVILYTARYMGRTNNNKKKSIKFVKKMTINQLKLWKLNYDEIFFGKPAFDLFIDDKSIFFKKNWSKLMQKML